MLLMINIDTFTDLKNVTNNFAWIFHRPSWGFSGKQLPLYRLKGPIINKASKAIIHRPLIHRPEIRRGYSVIFKMGPLNSSK